MAKLRIHLGRSAEGEPIFFAKIEYQQTRARKALHRAGFHYAGESSNVVAPGCVPLHGWWTKKLEAAAHFLDFADPDAKAVLLPVVVRMAGSRATDCAEFDDALVPRGKRPYGYQKAGGFDCSGFAFYVMKMEFGYPITVNERGGGAMAAKAKPRITRKKLAGGDLIFFGYQGPQSATSAIYHVGLYLGNGWFIHSTGSSDGVTLASLDSSTYWKTYFAWGRRLLSPEELAIPESPAQ